MWEKFSLKRGRFFFLGGGGVLCGVESLLLRVPYRAFPCTLCLCLPVRVTNRFERLQHESSGRLETGDTIIENGAVWPFFPS